MLCCFKIFDVQSTRIRFTHLGPLDYLIYSRSNLLGEWTLFKANPLGRGQLADFPRCSHLTYQFRYARRSRLENQPTDQQRYASYL